MEGSGGTVSMDRSDSTTRVARCIAHGRNGDWEAFCIDFDIAVQGRTLEEVKQALSEAICTYVEQAMAESPADRQRLLNRRMPLLTRIQLYWPFLVNALFPRKKGSRDHQAGFELPCPA